MFFQLLSFVNYIFKTWKSYSSSDIKPFILISSGPYLPFSTIIIVSILCNFIIPKLIQKRKKPFDTRPIEIIFHGFFLGIFGIAVIFSTFIFKGVFVFLSCKPILVPDIIDKTKIYFAIIGIIAIHFYSIHFILVKLNGRKINYTHLFYHFFSLIFGSFTVNYQPDEHVCFYVILELSFLFFYSCLQVLNSSSNDVKIYYVKLRINIYIYYLWLRQLQFLILFIHSLIHLFFNCTIKKEIAFVQFIFVIVFMYFFKLELNYKQELPYCNDNFKK